MQRKDHDHPYKGKRLTTLLKRHDYKREPSESDWEFRKRVFPYLAMDDMELATEVLMGAPRSQWNSADEMTAKFITNPDGTFPGVDRLSVFVRCLTDDPLRLREKGHQAA